MASVEGAAEKIKSLLVLFLVLPRISSTATPAEEKQGRETADERG